MNNEISDTIFGFVIGLLILIVAAIAKGYWYKLQIKIELKKEKEWLKELKQDE